MSSPRIVERRVGGNLWYVVSAVYPTALLARFAWDEIEARTKNWADRDAGIYRHGNSQMAGMVVSAVSMNRRSIVRLAGMLRHGSDSGLDEGEIDALITRRARVVLDQAGNGSGRLIIRRPDGRGARLGAFGEMIEPTPGEG